MKKYTTPEVEVIKFQIMETIADDDKTGPSGTAGVGSIPPDYEW